ncbi:pentatricopeptide repeat-containing protein At3g22690-like [Tasmannia lanceolata]|uniref:pentatricopeptide repeat-containing protein At3g22690-like n=1 Tax=Tasmannia lanceolata TaxID=3420 RepID=UPI0040643077
MITGSVSPLHSTRHLQPQTSSHSSTITPNPPTFTYPNSFISLLQECSTIQHLHQIHAQMLKTGAINNPPHLIKLISFCSYSNSNTLEYALKIFSTLPYRNSIIWNTIIRGFSISSNPEKAIQLYSKLIEQEPHFLDSYTIPSVLKACTRILALSEGTQIHGYVIKIEGGLDPFVQNTLMKLYSLCGRISSARRLFDKMRERNVVSWNCIIGGYAEMGCWEDVKSLFWLMVEEFGSVPSSITMMRMITACTRSGDYDSGRRIHRYIEENRIDLSLNLGNALVNMYAKFGEMDIALRIFDQLPDRDVVSWTTLISGYVGLGCLELARAIFDKMPARNVVAWNAMISGYVQNGSFQDAVSLFKEMLVSDLKLDKATFVSVLSACGLLGDLLMGRMVHGYIEKLGLDMTLDLVNSLLSMYSKCGNMDTAEWLFNQMTTRNEISWTLMMLGYVKCGAKDVAQEIFNEMPCKDVVSWNALISVFTQCNYFNEALGLFQEMQMSMVNPNGLTLVSVLSACATIGALELGKWIHTYIERNNIEMDVHLCSSLIDMYAKCGCIDLSLEVFNNMPNRDVLTWSTMIGGLSMHGRGNLALKLFKEMLEIGLQPDGIMFIGVLSACSHAGLVDEGRHYFNLMTQTYGISPEIEHYGCMVDLFGRRGLLIEAKELIESIPKTSNGAAIWGAFLGACRIHGNVELAEYATNHLLEVDPSNSGAYVLLSNVYAEASQWDGVGKVRNVMRGKGVQKAPGCSSIEVNGVVHEFFAGDFSHAQCKEISMLLDGMKKQLEYGHVVAITHLY